MERPSPMERIGAAAMELVERLDERYGDAYSVTTVALVVDVLADGPHGETLNPIAVHCSDPRSWIQAALLSEGCELADEQNQARIDATIDSPSDE